MSQTHSLTRSFSGNGLSFSKKKDTAGNNVFIFHQSVPIGTDTNYDFPLVRAKLLAMAMTASTDITIETNSGGAPDDTITLKAGEVYDWDLDRDGLSGGLGKPACPITTDIGASGVYITNAAISVVQIVAICGV